MGDAVPGLQETQNQTIMTQETFMKAQDLDSRIARLRYNELAAGDIEDEDIAEIKIMGRTPSGNEMLLATLEKKDPIRKYIADTLKSRIKAELETLKTQFNNL